jgi:hypothetical protein
MTFASQPTSPQHTNPPLPVGSVVAHRFELREALGRGGTGTVYRAHDRVSGRELALKLHPPPSRQRAGWS